MDLSGYTSRPFQTRRNTLGKKIGPLAALIASGAPSPRNYPANTYPFRASSHFLYLFGLPLRGAFGFWDGDTWTVFAPAPVPANTLWHGPEPSLSELQAAIGCPVETVDRLASVLEGRQVATLAAADPATRQRQQSLLGRPVQAARQAGDDQILANAMVALRIVHDDHAIAELRSAAAATRAAHLAGMRATRPGMRESQIRAVMEAEIMARDLTTSYGSIVSVHGEILHNEFYRNELQPGDLLLADVGAESAGGFAGDVTRTWPVIGRFSPSQRAIYDVVLSTQKDTIARAQPGVNYRDIHMNAMIRMGEGLVDVGILKGHPQTLVEAGAVSLFFPHGIGHLLGLDVHDMEDLGDRAGYSPGRERSKNFGLNSLRLDRDLVPGMAVTIEPGFYQVPAILNHPTLGRSTDVAKMVDWDRLAAFKDVRGIRIEDDILVTTNGHEVLTAEIPKEPAEIEDMVGG